MLSPELKDEIQGGYRRFLKAFDLKPRHGQKRMIAAIANSLALIEQDSDGHRANRAGISVIEAGTGTGKTLAYLLAALPVAASFDKKVIVATGTVALQEQLLNKDLPALLESTGWDTSVAIAKGRGRYLCPMRLGQCLDAAEDTANGLFLFEDEIGFDPSESNIQLYRDMAEKFESGDWNGDRDNWPETVDITAWRPLSVDRRQCAGRRCGHYQRCPYYQARDNWEDIDCLVANHDLVLADLALGGGVILPAPEDSIYVFDEAHKLGDTTLGHFAASTRLESSVTSFRQIVQSLRKQRKSLADDAQLIALIDQASEAAVRCDEAVTLALSAFRLIVDNPGSVGHGSVGQRDPRSSNESYRFPSGKVPEEVEETAVQCASRLQVLLNRLDSLQDTLNKSLQQNHMAQPVEFLEPLFQQVGLWIGRLEPSATVWRYFADSGDTEMAPVAKWVSKTADINGADIQVSASPTNPADILKERLFDQCFAAVLTSATLRTMGGFADFVEKNGLPDYAECVAIDGGFDYQRVGRIVVPGMESDGGNAQEHTRLVIDTLPDLLNLYRGTLVLFSSRAQMEAAYEGLDDELKNSVLVQNQLPHQRLIAEHRRRIDEGGRSAIFGLASFAEGVDLPGAYCEHVVIAKLPFSAPDDPVQATLSDWYETMGKNPFISLSLPETSIRLNQACGRLLRTTEDSGQITILDRRIVTKRYGKTLLADLPPFAVEIQ
ncbi:MAG: ATP-dependent DNA helicase DinG [bacterium]